MKIGFASVVMPSELWDLLDADSQSLLQNIRGITATAVTPLVRRLHERGHDISVFCLDPSVPGTRVLRGKRLVIYVFPKRRFRHVLLDFYRQECRLLREAILAENPQVVSAQWSYEHAWAALQTGIPTVVTCHDTPLRYAWIGKNWFTLYHLVMAWRVIRKAKRLICVSPYTVEHIRKYFFPRCPVDMVPNGFPEAIFERGARRIASARNAAQGPVICSLGGWGAIKNIPKLLKAFSRVRHVFPAAQLNLFGRELGPGQLAERWARRKSLQDGVSFVGGISRDDFLDFLETKADLLVHPSLVETFGMTFVEAIACGVPVIGGQESGAVPWTLDNGACGFLCNVRDEAVLAETILKALREPDQNRALVKRAWKIARDRFNMEHVATSYENILKQLPQ